MTSEPVSKGEFDTAMTRIDGRFTEVDRRFTELENHMNLRFAEFEGRMETRFAQQETVIERALVASIRWTVGMSFGLYALMFGLILFVVSRELAHP